MAMRVLMLLETDFPPDVRVEKEALSLAGEGYEVAIACCSLNRGLSSRETYKGIQIYRKHIPKFTWKTSVAALKFPFYYNFWKRYVSEIREDLPFDILHVHDLPLTPVGQHAKEKWNCKLVFDLHENYPALVDISPYSKTFLGRMLISVDRWRKLEKMILPGADAVITVVEEMAGRIRSAGVPGEIITVVPNYPDLGTLGDAKSSPGKEGPILFYSGGITYHRGLQVVIRALKQLVEHHPALRLWIVGSGSYLPEIKKLAARLAVEPNVEFLGWKPYPEMLSLLRKSDIALIPHLRSEQSDHSSPNKLFEYMYAGLPVLASDCRSVERVLSETKAGVVFESGNPDSLAGGLQKLSDPGIRKTMGERGRKVVRDRLNWSTSEAALVQTYKKLKKGS